MFKGETFCQAGLRKIRDETGIDSQNNKLQIKSLIHVWNTFFPDSNWDANRKPGCEGTQTVNAVVFCEFTGNDSDIGTFLG